jgi:LCP family protein required for cell wall assembly
MSLPRDLWVGESCSGREDRLNALLEGCEGVMNGPTRLVLGVEKLIGEPVDHYAMVDLAGFQEVVDEVGGYEICVDNEVRDPKANLALPAGCTTADGAQTLAWLRSRHTQELTSDGWRVMAGMNDLARNERQRGFLIDMMSRLSDFTSPQALATLARTMAPHLTIDDELTLGDAVDLAWAMRGLDGGHITELEVPVVDHLTDDGAPVLLPVQPVEEIVAGFLDSASTASASGAIGG